MTAFLKSAAVVTAVAAGVLSAGPARATAGSGRAARPGHVRVGFGQACTHRTGTVAFVLENTDRRRHTVSISAQGLSPTADSGAVPASRTVVVQFDIGAKGTTVSVTIDRGAPRTWKLKGCPRGDGDLGVIPGSGADAAGKPAAQGPAKQTNGGRAHDGRPAVPHQGLGKSAPHNQPAPHTAPHSQSGPSKRSAPHSQPGLPQLLSPPKPDHGHNHDRPTPRRSATPPPVNTA